MSDSRMLGVFILKEYYEASVESERRAMHNAGKRASRLRYTDGIRNIYRFSERNSSSESSAPLVSTTLEETRLAVAMASGSVLPS